MATYTMTYTGSKLGELIKDYIDNKNNTNNNTNTTTNNTGNDKNITAATSPSPMLPNGDDDKNDKNEKNKTNDKRWSNENPKDFENNAKHVFENNRHDHNLNKLLEKHNGNKVEALKEIEKKIIDYERLNGLDSTQFRKGVNIVIDGQKIVVRGNIVDGIVRIGTAFMP